MIGCIALENSLRICIKAWERGKELPREFIQKKKKRTPS